MTELSVGGRVSLRVADLRPQYRVLVIGAGPIGQMMVRWAAANGCDVACIDTVAKRLELARGRGLARPFALTSAQAVAQRDMLFGGPRPDVVIDTTGAAPVFADAPAPDA